VLTVRVPAKTNPEEADKLDKKNSLHNVCGAYVYSVDLDFDHDNGGGIVTLHFYKHKRKGRDKLSLTSVPRWSGDARQETIHTEVSFPFEVLTVRRTSCE
jgi:hypothetical protein